MDIKEAAHSEAAAQRSADTAGTFRRRAIAAGLSGAAVSLLPWLTGRASAGSKAASTDTTSPESTTSTTIPPKRPTPEDIVLLNFCQSMELTIVALYAQALDEGVFEGVTAETFNTIRQAHLAYAQSLSGTMGRQADNHRNEVLFEELKGEFVGDATSVAKAAANLENTAVATNTDIVSDLVGLDGSALVASFLVVEARQATVFQTFAGASSLEERLAFDATVLSPDDYPVE